MSSGLTRTNSFRKQVRPIYDIDEDDDDQRRDSTGRKRVDVIECLLDSSSDEIDDKNIDIEQTHRILWLTFDEICHIRFTCTRSNLTLDKQSLQIRRGYVCFCCRKQIADVFFLLALFGETNHEICFICKQIICQKCSYFNFQSPASKLTIPIRIQILIKPPSIPIDNQKEKIKKINKQAKTVCYHCLQIFNEHINTPQRPASPLRQTSSQRRKSPVRQPSLENPVSPLRRTFSLPPESNKSSNEVRHTRRRRPKTDNKIKKPTITEVQF